MTEFTVHDKIKSIAREIALRKRVYPKWIANGKMDSNAALREISIMEAILNDYQKKSPDKERHD